jgi:site-specific DNA-methyltransferase (adenine-specific)
MCLWLRITKLSYRIVREFKNHRNLLMVKYNKVYFEKNLITMARMEDNSIDLIPTDPPYAIGFMGKDWDKALPPIEVWKECFRVLKPGSFMFVMSSPRQDVLSRMIINLETAGFNISFTPIFWTYASGFPKAQNIGKKMKEDFNTVGNLSLDGSYSGFQPKPAVEVIIVCIKPISEKTYLAQAMKNGKGVSWLDDCRIPYVSDKDKESARYGMQPDITGGNLMSHKGIRDTNVLSSDSGRFPANLICSDDVLNDGDVTKSGLNNIRQKDGTFVDHKLGGKGFEQTSYNDSGSYSRYFDLDAWWEKQFKKLPKHAQEVYPFLIVPKPSREEKNKGCESLKHKKKVAGNYSQSPVCVDCKKTLNGSNNHDNCSGEVEYRKMSSESIGNNHPTVKPIKLMSYLIVLGSRPGDVVYDPYAGSGTTLVSGKSLDRVVVGSEDDQDNYNIAEARLSLALGQVSIFDFINYNEK